MARYWSWMGGSWLSTREMGVMRRDERHRVLNINIHVLGMTTGVR